jgi:hypothetical protein
VCIRSTLYSSAHERKEGKQELTSGRKEEGLGWERRRKEDKSEDEAADKSEDEAADKIVWTDTPYAPIMKMSQPPAIPNHVLPFLARPPHESPYNDVHEAIQCFLYGKDERGYRLTDDLSDGDALIVCYKHAQRLDPDSDLSKYQQAFMMINMYDIVDLCLPI